MQPSIPINLDDRERIIQQQQQQQQRQEQPADPERRDHYANELQLLSATCLGFALVFLSIFHNYVGNRFPGEKLCASQEVSSSLGVTTATPTKAYSQNLVIAYVGLGTAGFMWLFGIALISYEFSLLFRRGKPTNPHQRRTILHWFYFLAFLGVACSLVSHAVGMYLVHCNHEHIFNSYVVPSAGIFVLMLIVLLGILIYFKEN